MYNTKQITFSYQLRMVPRTLWYWSMNTFYLLWFFHPDNVQLTNVFHYAHSKGVFLRSSMNGRVGTKDHAKESLAEFFARSEQPLGTTLAL